MTAWLIGYLDVAQQRALHVEQEKEAQEKLRHVGGQGYNNVSFRNMCK